MTKIKLLALHSFRTSAAIFKLQIERTNIALDQAEIVYIDAPHPASGQIPRDVKPFFGDGPYFEWFTVSELGDQFEFDVPKLERSISYIEQVLREQGPFDGIIGFSQGSLLASVLVMLQNRGLILQTIPPLKFCILFAGLKVRAEQFLRHFASTVHFLPDESRYPPHVDLFKMGKVPVPSLHIYGDRDQIREHCVDLGNAFSDPVIIQHPRGHSIPVLQKHQLEVVRAFVKSFTQSCGEHPTTYSTKDCTQIANKSTTAAVQQFCPGHSGRRAHSSCPRLPSGPRRHAAKQVHSPAMPNICKL